ncbi:flagellin N-terminal helical domain-containing protein [Paracoccus everestensis]|uniref:flagellin N-terminal helical domain-containing protein n=1 Tax=Paracoccus everestensis TaxID=2903900 RepID=UPI001F3E5465|nr:flagellin [Paracoccus everestensis]
MSSILTNNGAIVALQTLKNVNANLNKAQSEIATGKSIGSAKDNAAVWAISKIMETDQSSLRSIQSSLNVAGATVGTALSGSEQIVKVLNEMKDLASRAGTDGFDFAKVTNDIAEKEKQITSIIAGTQMNGVNLLKAGGVPGQAAVTGTAVQNFTVLASLNRASGSGTTTAGLIQVASLGYDRAYVATDASTLATSGVGHSSSAIGTLADQDDVTTAVSKIENLLDIAVAGSAKLGAAAKRISDQSEFVGKLADSLKVGIGSLVDADMEEASARLQALQTQQQLGIQALSIANQAPSAIMSLFR